jgi:hypothetical protein
MNQAAHGKVVDVQVGDKRTGVASVRSSGEGILPPTPNPWFEDIKAFHALRSAGVDPVQAYAVVRQSSAQLARKRVRPVRVPAR